MFSVKQPVHISIFIKSQPLSAYLFNTQYDKTGSLHKALLSIHVKVLWLPRVLVLLFHLRAELATFFVDHNFHLKEQRTTDRLVT